MTPVTALLLLAAFLVNVPACIALGTRRGHPRILSTFAAVVLGPIGLLLLALGRRKPDAPPPSGFWYQRPDVLLTIVTIGLYGAAALRFASGAENVVTGGELENGLVAAIEKADPGFGPFRVNCPDVRSRQGTIAFCDLTVDGRAAEVRITLQDDEGHFTWEVVE